MKKAMVQHLTILALGMLLMACSLEAKRHTTDLYEIHPSSDNDSYYTPPTRGVVCHTIYESPSCSGG